MRLKLAIIGASRARKTSAIRRSRRRLVNCRMQALAPAAPEASSPLQANDALAIVAATLFDPFQATVSIRRLVGRELIRTSEHPRLVRFFSGVFRRNRRRKHRQRSACSTLLLAKLLPFAPLQVLGKFRSQISQRASRDRWSRFC